MLNNFVLKGKGLVDNSVEWLEKAREKKNLKEEYEFINNAPTLYSANKNLGSEVVEEEAVLISFKDRVLSFDEIVSRSKNDSKELFDEAELEKEKLQEKPELEITSEEAGTARRIYNYFLPKNLQEEQEKLTKNLAEAMQEEDSEDKEEFYDAIDNHEWASEEKKSEDIPQKQAVIEVKANNTPKSLFSFFWSNKSK